MSSIKAYSVTDDNVEANHGKQPATAQHDDHHDTDADASSIRRTMLKVNLLILPFVILCFCFLQFDRTNIGNALTDTLSRDIHIGNADVNLAQTLFTVGFIITEIPFNVISSYIGPARFLPITMFLWGVATWCQIFLTNSTGLLVTRFFIGALEGGYIPGFALYLSGYYTNAELASVYALFWASNAIAGALGGPLSIGLLSLAGRHGLAGWQWLFLIGTSQSTCSYVHSLAYTFSRRKLDLFSRSGCLLLPSSQRSESEIFLWKTHCALFSLRYFNHHGTSHQGRPYEN